MATAQIYYYTYVTDEEKKTTFVEPCAHKSTQTVFLGGKKNIVFTGCGSSALSC